MCSEKNFPVLTEVFIQWLKKKKKKERKKGGHLLSHILKESCYFMFVLEIPVNFCLESWINEFLYYKMSSTLLYIF